ncbi:MAG: hypothetical protein HKM04_05830 [Legionellales bacterium]|nr:hypothetical protein [Legionellales bacterium]
MLCGLNRKSFSERSHISLPTLRSWEEPDNNRGGLTKKGAERLINAFYLCGVICKIDWLLFGKGIAPQTVNKSTGSFFSIQDEEQAWSEEETILKDIISFKANNKNAVVATIDDKDMLPLFSLGDFVGGVKIFFPHIKHLIGLNCIIQTNTKLMVRTIEAIDDKNIATLTPYNRKGEALKDVDIIFAAEIVWHRRRASYVVTQEEVEVCPI